MKNIDINEGVVVGFNMCGQPLDCYGNIVPHKIGEKWRTSHKLARSIRRAKKLIKPEDFQKNT